MSKQLRDRILIAGLAELVRAMVQRPGRLEDVQPILLELVNVYSEAVGVVAPTVRRPQRRADAAQTPRTAKRATPAKSKKGARTARRGSPNGHDSRQVDLDEAIAAAIARERGGHEVRAT